MLSISSYNAHIIQTLLTFLRVLFEAVLAQLTVGEYFVRLCFSFNLNQKKNKELHDNGLNLP